ncbi:NAC transcription factor NAM-A1-like [Phoenix dactylifera]|uniref:NAC transcription factor NAM-A1-like n=1 Tax=Phoenix dactylifera TaxID=42345 RepID=A0A8B9A9T8_PHODC|nr:NAC transcription factor NAM-A1-like [Phoenix dactylifera]
MGIVSNYLERKKRFDGWIAFLTRSTGDFMHGVGEEVYYFTPRHRASANGSVCRANRNTGEGFWHGNARGQLIFKDGFSEVIRHKSSLVFKFRDSQRKRLHPNWIMHEYLLHSPDGKNFLALIGRIFLSEDGSMQNLSQGEQQRSCSSDGVVNETTAWTEQKIASQLVPLPGVLVDDRSTSTTIPAFTSRDAGFIDSNILNWVDNVILAPPSSPTSVSSGNQPMEVPPPGVLDPNSSTPSTSGDAGFNDSDILSWVDNVILATPSFPTPVPSGSQPMEVPPPGVPVDDRSTGTTVPPSTSGNASLQRVLNTTIFSYINFFWQPTYGGAYVIEWWKP